MNKEMSEMMNFKVDESKCGNCGLCSTVCPVLIIDKKTPFPTIKEGKESACMKCQHCLAVCSTGAITIWGKNAADSIPTSAPKAQPEEMDNLIRTRRSMRKFSKTEIDPELIYRLIETASYAPTAKNENAVQFTVVDNREDMSKLRILAYDYIKQASAEDRLPASKQYLQNFQNVWEAKQIDVIFRNAPHILIASAPKNNTSPKMDGVIAATHFDLLAQASGIGTLWDGFAHTAFEEVCPEIKADLNIPADHVIAAVLVFGAPGVKYARSIQNGNPQINTVKF